ncbi:MAG: gliding motility-associated C-terminal domain-containing protein [Chitinophagaceae bacterium]|nr:gliding motility-associated C-terminal domain-containing protein [Chitinophagaceae bacterium]
MKQLSALKITAIKYLFLFFLFVFTISVNAQGPCTTLGQTPSTAFPVCGTGVFLQSNVPGCVNSSIYVPRCTGGACSYQDINPFWYKFTCFQSGTLGLLIDPLSSSDDYDWQIWDITGQNPNVVLNNNSAVVIAANWSAIPGQTGTANNARNLIECCSFNNFNPPKFSALPNITAGRTYLLMVSNFSRTQQGYKLSFGGGTAVITDTKEPLMQEVKTNCGGDQLRLKLNKKMKCNSVAADGSDIVAFGGVTATSVNATGCGSGFETDSLIINLSAPLPPGTYVLKLKNGSDGNTILDICDRGIPTTDSLVFKYDIPKPTLLDSIAPVACAPNEVRFVFKKLIQCASIDANGSDFSISGTYPVTITGARGNCNSDGLTSVIIVSFNQSLQTKGTFTIRLRAGLDGNTIIDECNQVTPPSQLSFSVKDTVNADFTYSIKYGCLQDTVDYFHPGGNEINKWIWNFGSGAPKTNQNETQIYRSFGDKMTTLVVTNGFCSDTVTKNIRLNNFINADFKVNPFQCPGEPITLNPLPTSERPLTYLWNFGDGRTSTDSVPSPPHIYATGIRNSTYTITYTITNDLGCSSSIQKQVISLFTCRIDVPNAFTPNEDGLNDTFGPLNAVKADNYIFRIYNRWGQQIFESRSWLQNWDGTFKGILQNPDTYVWRLSYIDRDTKASVERRGTFTLIR